jgi:hypothetical protein
MALSHHEQQTLEQIAADLDAECDWTTWQLGGRARRSVRQHIVAGVLLVLVIMAMTCAVLVPHRHSDVGVLAVAVAGYLTMFAGTLLWCSNVGR